MPKMIDWQAVFFGIVLTADLPTCIAFCLETTHFDLYVHLCIVPVQNTHSLDGHRVLLIFVLQDWQGLFAGRIQFVPVSIFSKSIKEGHCLNAFAVNRGFQ